MAASTNLWLQKEITLKQRKRGCHLVTPEIVAAINDELQQIKVGIFHLFIKHTSASLTISENADPDVQLDMETHLNRIVPDVGDPGCPTIRHTEEGPDDMASHVKSALTSTSLSIPISNGRLAFGTWQGIWLLEHRFYGGPRRLVATINGSKA
ncbi:unnamed protein product [Agarophyton chilense]